MNKSLEIFEQRKTVKYLIRPNSHPHLDIFKRIYYNIHIKYKYKKRGINMLMKFIGKDSLGYVNGKIYNVEIQSKEGYIYLYCQNHVCCPYRSLKTLMNNWIEVE